MFRTIKKLIGLVILTLLICFMVNNRDIIIIQLFPLPFELESRVFIVMILFFLIGFVFGVSIYSKSFIFNAVANFFNKRKIAKLEKKTKKTNK